MEWPRIFQKAKSELRNFIEAEGEGGLGIISIKAQTIAMVGIMVLKVAQEGEHTLQHIYRGKIGKLSLK